MHIGLFGGAFDPPHNGHKKVTEALLENKLVEAVWFVPVFKHPWAVRLGKEFLSPYDIRLKMVEALVENISPEKTNVVEFKDVSYVYPTLQYFSEKYSEHTFSWIMGSEYLPKFDDFLKVHPHLLEYHFFIYPRSGVPYEPKYKNMTFLDKMDEVDISSSMVREKINKEESTDSILLQKVLKTIIKNNLYI